MKKINKYAFNIDSLYSITIPKGGVIRKVAYQRGVPCVWVEFDEFVKELENLTLVIFATGADIYSPIENASLSFLDTITKDGTFVWHVYQLIKKEKEL